MCPFLQEKRRREAREAVPDDMFTGPSLIESMAAAQYAMDDEELAGFLAEEGPLLPHTALSEGDAASHQQAQNWRGVFGGGPGPGLEEVRIVSLFPHHPSRPNPRILAARFLVPFADLVCDRVQADAFPSLGGAAFPSLGGGGGGKQRAAASSSPGARGGGAAGWGGAAMPLGDGGWRTSGAGDEEGDDDEVSEEELRRRRERAREKAWEAALASASGAAGGAAGAGEGGEGDGGKGKKKKGRGIVLSLG